MKPSIQTNSVQQFLATHLSTSRLFFLTLLLALLSAFFPLQASADTAINDRFELYIFNICNNPSPPASWDQAKLNTLCTAASTGGYVLGNAGYSSSSNLGTSDPSSGTTSPNHREVYECLDDFNREAGSGCATGGWGLLLSTQFGRSVRPETELENGFQSDLRSLLIGLDYRFTDSFILGATASQTRDDADFINNAGSLKTINNILTMYTTWLPTEKISVDGYIGYGAVNFDSKRQIYFGPISGTTIGNTTGRQAMAGISSAYQSKLGNINVSPFLNLDYIKTDIRGYNESGTTNLELHYGDRTTISATASLGARLSQSYTFKWGSLTPSLHGAGVHEFQNNSTLINNELVLTPGTGFLVETDAPDRDYFLSGLGVVAALNSGTQLFMNYEKRSGDSLLDSWVVSLGLLKEF